MHSNPFSPRLLHRHKYHKGYLWPLCFQYLTIENRSKNTLMSLHFMVRLIHVWFCKYSTTFGEAGGGGEGRGGYKCRCLWKYQEGAKEVVFCLLNRQSLKWKIFKVNSRESVFVSHQKMLQKGTIVAKESSIKNNEVHASPSKNNTFLVKTTLYRFRML